MNKTVSILVAVGMVLGIGSFTYFQAREAKNLNAGNDEVGANVHTIAEVASHADGKSCWTVINGNVYDLTAWIPEHPGGSRAILKLCGINGSEEFNEQHGGMQPMESVLAGFRIGSLAQ